MPIIDTSRLIYLIKINRLLLLKSLFSKISIIPEIVREMENGIEGITELKEEIGDWIKVEPSGDRDAAEKLSLEEGISYTDALLILFAKNKKDILVSNDSVLIRIARAKGVKCWWFIRCIIEALKIKIISKKESREILLELVKSGMYLDNEVYAVLLEEIERL